MNVLQNTHKLIIEWGKKKYKKKKRVFAHLQMKEIADFSNVRIIPKIHV